QTPTDIFARPQMQPPASPTPTPVDQAFPRNPQTPPPPPPPEDSAAMAPREGAVTAAAIMGPRISPQPSTLQLAAGESRDWTIMGMDLEGLETPHIKVHYDPSAVQVIQAFPGDAILVDRALPVIAIDPANGVITLSSGDGLPLRFRTGGQLMALTVRGTGAGESMVVLDPVVLLNASGARVEGLTQGGRVAVR
ncbi:MAG TPA: hypothetical protein VFV54_07315, partial [Thermoanaerobaculia bacterium]|nr:hypothetical protein [Thermoanaerobaculia bacterium]